MLGRVKDGVGRRRAARRDYVRKAVQAEDHRKFRGKAAVGRRWNCVNTALARVAGEPVAKLPFRKRKPAAAGAENNAETLSVAGRKIISLYSRIRYRLTCGCQRERHGTRNVLPVFGDQLGFPVKLGYLCGYLYVEA